jgi:hypothetical protein
MDGNSKLGPDIIRGDPHTQTDNGKILAGIIERNALCVINNSSAKCKGKITKRRVTKRQTEESIIDFVLSCEDMEMYNLKDKEGLKKFKEITSEDSFLSSVFTEEGNIETQTKNFLKRLGYCMSKSFKKIRVNKNKKNKDLEELFNLRRILKTKKDDESYDKLVEVETKLANICADDNARTIQEACEGLSCEGGGINAGKLWKLKK